MKDKHRHHIIPRHMGGTDDESNLTPPIPIKEHAELHRELWEKHGYVEDYIAWKALDGRITGEQARLMAAKAGQDRSDLYKESRQRSGAHLNEVRTFECCSKGGTAAAPKLIEWQHNNREEFIRQCATNGKSVGPKLEIPHVYMGLWFKSKKDLQEHFNMSRSGFYGKLRRGEIQRLPKLGKAAQ